MAREIAAMRVACVQYDIAWHDKPANFAKVRSLLAAAGGCEPGGLIVLPEMFSTGFSMDLQATAEGQFRPAESFLPKAGVGGGAAARLGPAEVFLAELARHYGCHVLGGVVNVTADGLGRNEAVLFGPAGQEIMRYAKMHPFSYAGEKQYFSPGNSPVVADLACCEPGRQGPARLSGFICYDLRFPEVFRSAAMAGAEVLAVIANWPASRCEHWRALLVARAIENQAWVVGVNRAGSDPDVSYFGGSAVVDPRGRVVAEATDGEMVLPAELDMAALRQYRREFPALDDARPGWVRRLGSR
jgi:predicted amidohydrolase